MGWEAMQRSISAGRGAVYPGQQSGMNALPQWGNPMYGQGGNYNFYNANPYSQYDANSAYAAGSMPAGMGLMSTAHRDFGGNMGQAMGQMGQMLGANADRQQQWDIAQMANQNQQQKYGMLYSLFAPLFHSGAFGGSGGQQGSKGYISSYGAMNVDGQSNPSNLMRMLAGSKLINNIGAGQNLGMAGNAQLRNWSGLA